MKVSDVVTAFGLVLLAGIGLAWAWNLLCASWTEAPAINWWDGILLVLVVRLVRGLGLESLDGK